MRYFYQDATLGRLGPYSMEDLRDLHLSGGVRLDTPVFEEGNDVPVTFDQLWLRFQNAPRPPSAHPPPLPGTGPPPEEPGFTKRARDDLKAMLPHLTVPLEEFRTLRFLDNRQALAIAGVGLLPLVIFAAFPHAQQVGNALWALALYFSVLWALFFYYVFPTPQARVGPACVCFFGTGLMSVGVLLQIYRLWPLDALVAWVKSSNLGVQWLGHFLAVGLPEELCKASVVLFVARRFGPLPPQAVLFYGLIAGLGFGIYEGVRYQTLHNVEFALHAARRADGYFAAHYYLLNMIRLTTLPFLHAIWTGIAGYFIGFGELYPERKRGLFIVAIGLPALLHGTYNTLSGNALGLVVALVSVLALTLYLAKSVDFDALLASRKDNSNPRNTP